MLRRLLLFPATSVQFDVRISFSTANGAACICSEGAQFAIIISNYKSQARMRTHTQSPHRRSAFARGTVNNTHWRAVGTLGWSAQESEAGILFFGKASPRVYCKSNQRASYYCLDRDPRLVIGLSIASVHNFPMCACAAAAAGVPFAILCYFMLVANFHEIDPTTNLRHNTSMRYYDMSNPRVTNARNTFRPCAYPKKHTHRQR